MTVYEIKVHNTKKVLFQLLAEETSTKLNLVLKTGLSNSTLSDCINCLERLNIVYAVGVEDSIGGRRPSIYAINPEYGYFIGIKIDLFGVCATITNTMGKLIKSYPAVLLNEKSVMVAVYSIIDLILSEFPIDKILGMGIATNGEMEASKGIIIYNNQIGWNNVHIKELIERKYSIHTHLDHIADIGALYEQIFGHCKENKNFLCIYPEQADKIGIVIDGRILRGKYNRCGQLPEIVITPTQLNMLKYLFATDTVLVGYRNEETELSLANSTSFNVNDEYFSRAAAIMAQTRWFDAVYNMM